MLRSVCRRARCSPVAYADIQVPVFRAENHPTSIVLWIRLIDQQQDFLAFHGGNVRVVGSPESTEDSLARCIRVAHIESAVIGK